MADIIMIDITDEPDNSKVGPLTKNEYKVNDSSTNAIPTTVTSPIKKDTVTSSPASARKMTPKQLEKEKEKLEREKQRELERIEREKIKEAERQLKEEKRIQRELEKKKREEEKERIKKENEAKREQQKRERDEKERKKQEEKDKRAEEKLKKDEEKRLAEESKKKAEEAKKKEAAEKSKKADKLKISNFFKPKTTVKSIVPAIVDEEQASDYSKTFKDFYIRNGTKIFDFNRLKGESLKKSIDEFDSQINSNKETGLQSWFKEHKKSKQNPVTSCTATYIYENQLDGSMMNIRAIRFYENVRSWVGSYSKPTDKSIAIKPFSEPVDIFIEWDDGADEDEEGEGEVLSENDEDEEDDDEEDDFDDFLEDDNDNKTTKKILGPLVPVINWKSKQCNDYKVEILKEDVLFPINPNRDYWKKEAPEVKKPLNTDSTQQNDENSPPRKKPKTLITNKADLETFATEVHDSDFNLSTLVDILKKKFPSYTKVSIENTLRYLAKRVGPKATERKWAVDRELLDKIVAET